MYEVWETLVMPNLVTRKYRPPPPRPVAHMVIEDDEEVKGSLPAKPTPATAARLRRAWFRLRRAWARRAWKASPASRRACARLRRAVDALEARLVKEKEMAEAAVAPKTAPSRRRRPPWVDAPPPGGRVNEHLRFE